jgi:hypothetical protein
MKTIPSWTRLVCLFMGLLLFNVLLNSSSTPIAQVPATYWLTLFGSMLFLGSGIVLQERNYVRSHNFGLVSISFGLLLIIASFVFEYSGFGWTGTSLITLGMVAMASMGTMFVIHGLWEVVQNSRA